MNFSSTALDQLVNQFSQLPGIGKRSALRFALFMLRQPKEEVLSFANALSEIIEGVKYCKNCHKILEMLLLLRTPCNSMAFIMS
jgi:recombination protein RecR